MSKITIIEDITRSVKVDNSSDAKRKYDIEGIAQMEHGEVKRIESVVVKLGDRKLGAATVGNASKTDFIHSPMTNASDEVESPYAITGSFYGDKENTNAVIIGEVEKFVDDVKAMLDRKEGEE